MKASQLLKNLKTVASYPGVDFEVFRITCNSKRVVSGSIFIAIDGSRQRGGDFIPEAIKNGAMRIILSKRTFLECKTKIREYTKNGIGFVVVADSRKTAGLLASQFYNNPSDAMHVVGITGTNGKTTISYLIEAIVKQAKKVPGVIGTINYRYAKTVIQSSNTTPGPVELQELLSKMRKQKVKFVAMEVSSHSLDQDRCSGVNFQSAIFTNLTQDHLDYHHTLKEYFNAKAKLFEGLSEDAWAIINADDRYANALIRKTRACVMTYAIHNQADVYAQDIKNSLSGTQFTVCYKKNRLKINSRLIGVHNVYNMLASCAWAFSAGFSFRQIVEALEKFSSVPGRLQRVSDRKQCFVFVDYAHTDDALKNVLQSLRQITSGKIIVVFGCGGDRDKGKRSKMGRVAALNADYSIITSDNPRSESAREIAQQICSSMNTKKYQIILDRKKAIQASLLLAHSHDTVLIAGKGHEQYQIIGKKTIAFDDVQVARECLQ